MTSLLISYCFKIWEGIFDCYWTIYKSQIPLNSQCLDDGPEFRAKLTFFGKILHKIRPLMIRKHKHKRKNTKVERPAKPPKRIKDHTVIHSKIYYTLISNIIHVIVPGYISHISSNDDKHILTSNYYDNSCVFSRLNDLDVINKWFCDDCVSYLITDDICMFPCFDNISFPTQIRRTLIIKNAGGNSEISEALSMQFMFLEFGADQIIPEMEIKYIDESKMCDYVMKVKNDNIGVSVTRAISHPNNSIITPKFATALLQKKLLGIIIAKKTITTTHKFSKSIVHVWCKSLCDAEIVKTAYKMIIENDIYNLYSGIYVICSICDAEFIYTNDKNT